MNYGGYIVRLYLRQSGRIGRDAKTIGYSSILDWKRTIEIGRRIKYGFKRISAQSN